MNASVLLRHLGKFWKGYIDVKTDGKLVQISQELLLSAVKSATVAQGSYTSGVGSIIEVLNAQSELANARQQHAQSLAGWNAARIRLAANIGAMEYQNID